MNLNPQRKLYLCSPDFLELKYEINPWMDVHADFSQGKALQQWKDLVNIYKKLAPESVHIIPPQEGLTELCYFGDSVFAYKGKAVFSRLAMKQRYAETEYVMEYCAQQGIQGMRVPEGMVYEGSGETMVWKDKILVGYGQRSSPSIVPYLREYFDMETIGFKLIDPRLYHLDTVLFPISTDLIAVYPDAMTEESQEKLTHLDAEILVVSEKDVMSFGLNSVALENDIIMHTGARDFGNILKKRGFTIHYTDISEFLKFGGGLKCLTFQRYL